MYNRYIHQNDGSFQRQTVPDRSMPMQSAPQPLRKEETFDPVQSNPNPPQPIRAGSFLRQLLPKSFDTGDLIIVLLMLLMAGDCEEERNTALLTLALYFFM